MGTLNPKTRARLKRKKRIRKKILGTTERPRFCVFRSARHIYAQVIDDAQGQTIAAASSLEKVVQENADLKGKVAVADFIGGLCAQRAQEKGIKQVVFDRNGFLYHGRVKAVSEGARKAGMVF